MDLQTTLAQATALQSAIASQQQALQSLTSQSQTLQTSISAILESLKTLATPPPTTLPANQNPSLARVQTWLGDKTVGVYFGTDTVTWRAPQFVGPAQEIKSWGADYGIVKFGADIGVEWYDGTVADIRKSFTDTGLGMAPYLYVNPGQVTNAAQIALHLCSVCEGVILDIEDGWGGYDSQLRYLLDTLHRGAPDACVILTGYGDPLYRFGQQGFPHGVVKAALAQGVLHAYQPQWYFGVWDVYKNSGWQAAIDWGDADVASAYGADAILQPAISIEGVHPSDFQPVAQYLKNWHAGIALWYKDQGTADIVHQLKAGLSS